MTHLLSTDVRSHLPQQTHYVMFDTETDLGTGLIGPDELNGGSGDDEGPFGAMDQQIDFLKKDLAGVNRALTPWVVAMGHRPWYMATAVSSLCIVCQEAFEQIFYENNVDLVMHGHVHAANRNDPIYRNVTDPNLLNNPRAPWYVVNGAAGHYDGLDTLIVPRPSYVAFANDTEYSYSRLTFHNRTHCECLSLLVSYILDAGDADRPLFSHPTPVTHEYVVSATGLSMDTSTLYKEHSLV
jgi:hypothetical protein